MWMCHDRTTRVAPISSPEVTSTRARFHVRSLIVPPSCSCRGNLLMYRAPTPSAGRPSAVASTAGYHRPRFPSNHDSLYPRRFRTAIESGTRKRRTASATKHVPAGFEPARSVRTAPATTGVEPATTVVESTLAAGPGAGATGPPARPVPDPAWRATGWRPGPATTDRGPGTTAPGRVAGPDGPGATVRRRGASRPGAVTRRGTETFRQTG